MTGKELGWGRLSEGGLTQIMVLHTVYADLVRRTPYIARARGSNLLSHVLDSLRQAVAEKPVAGAIGKPGDVALVIVGHDTNLSNLSGMLEISWLLPGYQPDDTPPGGSLVLELWRAAGGKQYSVRTYYTAQKLDQMRQAVVFDSGLAAGEGADLHSWMQHRVGELRLRLGRFSAHSGGRNRFPICRALKFRTRPPRQPRVRSPPSGEVRIDRDNHYPKELVLNVHGSRPHTSKTRLGRTVNSGLHESFAAALLHAKNQPLNRR